MFKKPHPQFYVEFLPFLKVCRILHTNKYLTNVNISSVLTIQQQCLLFYYFQICSKIKGIKNDTVKTTMSKKKNNNNVINRTTMTKNHEATATKEKNNNDDIRMIKNNKNNYEQ